MIVVKLQGGLGNQMFQYALGRELQHRDGGGLCFDLTWLLDRTPRAGVIFRDYDLDIFDVRPRFTLLSELARRWPVPLLYMYGGHYLSRVRERAGLRRRIVQGQPLLRPEEVLQATGDLYLDGFWQSPKYFPSCEARIRREFTVREPLSPAGERMAALMAETDSICVNVRRADYVSLQASIDMHGFVGREYYDRGIALIAPRLANPHVFVTSDDVDWCRDNLHFGYPTTVLGHEYKGRKFGQYLTLMSRCKHFLIPNSSFAWWAAWLNPSPEKIVVCPKNWFRDPTIDASDMIPERWLRI